MKGKIHRRQNKEVMQKYTVPEGKIEYGQNHYSEAIFEEIRTEIFKTDDKYQPTDSADLKNPQQDK